MSRSAQLLVGSVLLLVGASNARATILWTGDFSTGDLSQWSSEQEQASNRLSVVTSPVPANEKYALQVLVEPGDVASNGNRAELAYTGDSPAEGDVRYYHWQTYFPADFDPADYWQIFTQWHQYISGGSPPLAIMVWGNNIQLGNEVPVYFWTAPLVTGVWHDFIVHVVWSSDATVGGVELWYDGAHVLSFTNVATLFAGDTIYVKQGLYRKDTIAYNQTLYEAGMTIGTELSDVLPSGLDAGTPVPDAGTPVPDAGPAVPDAGTTIADAGSQGSDAGGGSSPDLDAGHSHDYDAGSAPLQADAGTAEPPGDAGPVVSDAGDGSSPDGWPDAGATLIDAGPPAGADAGDRSTGQGDTPPDAGPSASKPGESDGTPKPHFGCSSAGVSMLTPWLTGAWLLRRRRTGTRRH